LIVTLPHLNNAAAMDGTTRGECCNFVGPVLSIQFQTMVRHADPTTQMALQDE
tara:strand:- start:54301 stop:54459 length:159 start_codon:yes stop_codon:yes gene_type:complete